MLDSPGHSLTKTEVGGNAVGIGIVIVRLATQSWLTVMRVKSDGVRIYGGDAWSPGHTRSHNSDFTRSCTGNIRRDGHVVALRYGFSFAL